MDVHAARNELTPERAFKLLQEWFLNQQALKDAKVIEVVQRKDVAKYYFPSFKEGTNRFDLDATHDLVMVASYNYKVDEAAIDQLTPKQVAALKLPWDDLFVYKPELSISTYRALTPEQKKVADQLLIITDGTPQLSIMPKSDTAGQKRHKEAALAAVVSIVEDMEQAKAGDYYEDGDGDWWLCTAVGETGENEWDQVEDPRPAKKPKARKRAAKKAVAS